MKMQKLVSMTASAMIAVSSIGSMPQAAAAKTDDVPEWIPQSYEDALDFSNNFGATRCIENMACLVFRESRVEYVIDDPYIDVIPIDTITAEGCKLKTVYRQTFYPTAEMEKFGDVPYQYEVVVFQPEEIGEFTVRFSDTLSTGSDYTSYTFASDGEIIEETDIYSWLPDCEAEYESFTMMNGNVSTHGNYALFCLSGSVGTAYQWTDATTAASAPTCLKLFKTQGCSRRTIGLVAGGTSKEILLYRPVADGRQKITWEFADFNGDVLETVEGDFQVTDGGQNILLPDDARFEVIDNVTGKPVDFDTLGENKMFAVGTDIGYKMSDGTWVYTGPITILETNPFVEKGFGKFFHADSFSFMLSPAEGYKMAQVGGKDYTHTELYANGAYNICFYVEKAEKEYLTGDLNDDGYFNSGDLYLLRDWLLGIPDVPLSTHWEVADLDGNDRLDTNDYTLMQQLLVKALTEEPRCTMTLFARYSGTGVDGQDLGKGQEKYIYTVRAGDKLYEIDNGWVTMNELEKSKVLGRLPETPILTIVSVGEEGVTVIGNYMGNFEEQLIPYDNKIRTDVCMQMEEHTIYDGINYTYGVMFGDYHGGPIPPAPMEDTTA